MGADTLVLGAMTDSASLAIRVDRVDTLRLDGAELTLTPEVVAGVVDGLNAITGTQSLLLTGDGAAYLKGFEEIATEFVDYDGESLMYRVFESDGITLYADMEALDSGALTLELDDGLDFSGIGVLAAHAEAPGLPALADVLDDPLNVLDSLLGPQPPVGFVASEVPVADEPLVASYTANFGDLLDVVQPLVLDA